MWEGVLAQLASGTEDELALAQHAGAMMLAAARATQSGIDPARLAQGREESLLGIALEQVRRECRTRGLVSLRLTTADALAFLTQVRAPRIVGEPRLTVLQAALAAACWPGESLLLAPSTPAPAPPVRQARATDLEQELAACAAWCRNHMERNPGARLLVLSACIEPSLSIQAAILWRALSVGAPLDERARARWLAVEGGEPLLHQALAADALMALELAAEQQIDSTRLQALLRSPYAGLAADATRLRLRDWLADLGLGRWERGGLVEALRLQGEREPAADSLAQWLLDADVQLAADAPLHATEWARRFTAVLDAAAFARAAPLDSREQQRLSRWNELLDEFAGLDAVLPAMMLPAALARLKRLAAQARHQGATADAAITLSDQLADPVVGYDGIWVLGLAENRWPAAPRPDAWVAIAEQRRAHWPESGVTQRREQALWALQCWRRRGGELVLSHPVREGDLLHRPTALAGDAEAWRDCDDTAPLPLLGAADAASDQQLQPLGTNDAPLLRGGTARLVSQQACPFRAQAQFRLGAQPPPPLSQGVPLSLRGRLLHLLLQHLWQALGDQARLLSLDGTEQARLIAKCWITAVQETPAARWLPAQVLDRERARAAETIARVLQLERARAPFTVEQREGAAEWQGAGARVSLRIDRIDRVGGDAVLLDYKSGAPARIQLHEDSLQPLQLAIYAAALAQHGRPVRAAALLNLHPWEPQFAGVTARDGLLPDGLHQLDDWDQAQQQWQQQLLALMQQHLSGDATLTRDRQACIRCHLPALCRRAGADETEASDE